MRMLSNGNGSVRAEDDGIVYGWRGGQLIGSFPMPLERSDADMMVRLSTHGEGRLADDIGLAAEMFIRSICGPASDLKGKK